MIEIKRENIKRLRQLGRDPEYCNKVSKDELDEFINLILRDDDHSSADARMTVENKVDIIATISNIVLINRDLHLSYFIPKYSKSLLLFCNQFVNQVNNITISNNFQELVPVYRLIFLTLYGGLDDVGVEIITNVFNVLFDGFNDCVKILDSCHNNQDFQLLLIEILKCLYTLHHKYHYGSNLIDDEHFSDDCARIINTCSKRTLNSVMANNESLLIKNSLNFLLVLFSEREEVDFKELFKGPKELYLEFFDNITFQLKKKLKFITNLEKEESTRDHIPHLVNQLVILNHMSKLLLSAIKSEVDNREKFNELFAHIRNLILPNDKTTEIYNELMKILISSAFPNLSATRNFSQMNQLSFMKELTIGLFYALCYDPNAVKHQEHFFELIGFLNANAFLEKFGIQVDSSIDLEQLTKPTSKYLDRKLLLSSRTALDLHAKASEQNSQESNNDTLDDWSEEDKEKEAEKLFVLFDRMEKLGTFENFKNPVKQWQQEGKFEDLDNQ